MPVSVRASSTHSPNKSCLRCVRVSAAIKHRRIRIQRTEDMTVTQAKQKKPDPSSIVIFGVTGDLAHRLVIPALYNLAANDLLPDNFCIVGVARQGMSSEELTKSLTEGLHQFATRKVDDSIA